MQEKLKSIKVRWEQEEQKERKNNTIVNVAEMCTWEENQAIMRKKAGLKGSKAFMDHDLTTKEREIQRKLTEMEMKERQEGKEVNVRYKKIRIEGKWSVWDDRKESLVMDKGFGRRKEKF